MVTHDQLLTLCESYRKHPDQGIKACKKTLLKNPKSLLHQLALAWFTANLGNGEDALKLCDEIDVKSPDWAEPDLVVEFQDLVTRCRGTLGERMSTAEVTKITTLWKDQFDKYGKLNHRQIREDMFCAAFANDSWELLQQLFAWLQRDFPRKPQYHFAWIMATQILADGEYNIGEKLASYFNLLAHRSVQAILANTRQDKDTPKKLASTQELRLITYVLQRQNDGQELLALLDDPALGINSDIGKGDVEFIRLKLGYLAQQGKADALFEFCLDSLKTLFTARTSKPGTNNKASRLMWADDWAVWNDLVKAASVTDRTDQAAAIIDSYLQMNPRSRNAGRARLDNMDMVPKSDLISEILNYTNRQSHKPSCFEDIRSALVRVSKDDGSISSNGIQARIDEITRNAKDLVQQVFIVPTAAESTNVTTAVNGLKIQYMLSVAPRRPSTAIRIETANDFITDCLQLFKICCNPHIPEGDDACILAVMALTHLAFTSVDEPVKSSRSTPSTNYLLQAVMLVKFLITRSPYNFHAKMLAVRLNALLGLLSESCRQFMAGLDIKQVQWDSLGHLLFTRISTLHPIVDGSNASRKTTHQRLPTVQEGLNEALAWNKKASDSITNMLARDLDTLPYDKLPEFSNFKRRIDESFSHAMLTLESRRIARCNNKPVSTNISELPARIAKARRDNRDMASFPDYEFDSLSLPFITLTSLGPRPDRYWFACWAVDDLTQSLLTMPPGKLPPEALIRAINEAMKFVDENPHREGQESTAAEKMISDGRTSLNFLACHLAIGARDAYASTNLKSDFKSLLDFIVDKIEGKELFGTSGDPAALLTWHYFHTRYLALEHLKAVDKLCDFALATAKQKAHPSAAQVPGSLVNEIKKKGREQGGRIQKEAKELAKVLKTEGVGMYLVATETGQIGKLATELIGLPLIKKWIGEMLEDLIEGVEGLAALKVY